MAKRGKIWIGTSNIALPGNKHSRPEAYRDKSRLTYYSSIFNSLEVNSSFYKLPKAATFEKWTQEVPGNFQFSAKLSKDITHSKALEFENNLVDVFFKAAAGLSGKTGCVLVQFPGKITMEHYNNVERILSGIRNAQSGDWRVAVEFRNPSWYQAETYELMNEYGASIVLHDIPKSKHTIVNNKTAFVYLRFHGPTGNYRGSYGDEVLLEYANNIKTWLSSGKDVYAYFNNTMGSAFENAVRLQELTSKK